MGKTSVHDKPELRESHTYLESFRRLMSSRALVSKSAKFSGSDSNSLEGENTGISGRVQSIGNDEHRLNRQSKAPSQERAREDVNIIRLDTF